MSNENNIAVVILAAGLGTRMKSEKAKVLHEIDGRTMISYVLETALGVASSENIVVVIGCQAEAVRSEALKKAEVRFAYQDRQLGTGHAVLCALGRLPENVRDVVILCGDVPFISCNTIKSLVKKKREDNLDVTVLAVRLEAPTGYGRIIFNDHEKIVRIVEESDASSAEKAINVVNAGTYCVDKTFLNWSLVQIKANNKQNEMYLTDIVEIACGSDRSAGALISQNSLEVIGINSLEDLRRAESSFRQKRG